MSEIKLGKISISELLLLHSPSYSLVSLSSNCYLQREVEMYLDFLVSIPDVPGKIVRKRIKETVGGGKMFLSSAVRRFFP